MERIKGLEEYVNTSFYKEGIERKFSVVDSSTRVVFCLLLFLMMFIKTIIITKIGTIISEKKFSIDTDVVK